MNNTVEPSDMASRPAHSRDRRSSAPEELEELLDELQTYEQKARRLTAEAPGNHLFLQAAHSIVAMDFFAILNRFDTGAFVKRLNEKPELYFQLINAQCALLRATLERDKFEWKKQQAEKRRQERDQKLRARKPILVTAEHVQFATSALTSAPPSKDQAITLASPVAPIERPPSSVPHAPHLEPLQLTPEDIQVMEEALRTAADPPDAWVDSQPDEEGFLIASSS